MSGKIAVALCLGASLVLSGCVGSGGVGAQAGPSGGASLATLDGSVPLVIGHRGFSGRYPEETRPSYEAAADAGADSLEMDLHLSKDCQLVARHNPWLSDNTNIAEVAATNRRFAERKRTVPGRLVNVPWAKTADSGPEQYLSDLSDSKNPKSVLKSLIVDGEDHTGDWSISDFTVAELKQIGGTTCDAKKDRPTTLNGQHPILSFQEIIDIARAKSRATGRPLSVYPETKNPVWNNAQAIANGCGQPGSRPLEDELIRVLDANGLNSRDAAIYVQSFDPASLKYLRAKGVRAKLVQLTDGNEIDFKTGALVYDNGKASDTIAYGRPFSWTLGGEARYYGALLTPEGLAEIRKYADGIGVWKPQVMSHTVSPWPADPAYKATLAAVNTLRPTGLVANAHKAGLFVHVFTFRNEKQYLAGAFKGDPQQELLAYYRIGVDGVFADFVDTAQAARAAYLKEIGR